MGTNVIDVKQEQQGDKDGTSDETGDQSDE